MSPVHRDEPDGRRFAYFTVITRIIGGGREFPMAPFVPVIEPLNGKARASINVRPLRKGPASQQQQPAVPALIICSSTHHRFLSVSVPTPTRRCNVTAIFLSSIHDPPAALERVATLPSAVKQAPRDSSRFVYGKKIATGSKRTMKKYSLAVKVTNKRIAIFFSSIHDLLATLERVATLPSAVK